MPPVLYFNVSNSRWRSCHFGVGWRMCRLDTLTLADGLSKLLHRAVAAARSALRSDLDGVYHPPLLSSTRTASPHFVPSVLVHTGKIPQLRSRLLLYCYFVLLYSYSASSKRALRILTASHGSALRPAPVPSWPIPPVAPVPPSPYQLLLTPTYKHR